MTSRMLCFKSQGCCVTLGHLYVEELCARYYAQLWIFFSAFLDLPSVLCISLFCVLIPYYILFLYARQLTKCSLLFLKISHLCNDTHIYPQMHLSPSNIFKFNSEYFLYTFVYNLRDILKKSSAFTNVTMIAYDCMLLKVTNMSDKSELKAELERKKQRLAQIREEKKRKEEERKKKEVCMIFKINLM